MNDGPSAPPARREEQGVPPRLRGLVSRLLLGGLLLAVAFLLIGLVGYLKDGQGLGPGNAAVAFSGNLVQGLATGAPGAFVLVGLAVLLATPLSRVVVSVALFASVGDRAFTTITLFVLLLLAATIVVGFVR